MLRLSTRPREDQKIGEYAVYIFSGNQVSDRREPVGDLHNYRWYRSIRGGSSEYEWHMIWSRPLIDPYPQSVRGGSMWRGVPKLYRAPSIEFWNSFEIVGRPNNNFSWRRTNYKNAFFISLITLRNVYFFISVTNFSVQIWSYVFWPYPSDIGTLGVTK